LPNGPTDGSKLTYVQWKIKDRGIAMKKAVLFVAIIFVLSFLLELVFEKLGKVDSIGLWYTSLVALICTAVISIVIAFVPGVRRLLIKK
jgi:uncharacterized membrane protein